ncbi:uncharacterized protein ACLA_071330 [Aspergillus clavatus NRRL 1]|uniref:Bromo domain-containing protein n=1 Tax=Aspergillus clavatus (strain ATCC 1007 / CBS 513.65 / DSM 816 / NCTC 3887 / NRRL 1 / QM 1276 / 107) TaxID=344612 RepID=A1C6S9_ASPCL|nr:uncharacterized protein ACLA_071330 [Aspergillus clavatus NRRL 1]EAW14100.1 conserved hypothetical protein [Aspergillus clavatus NRRL 1]
MPPLSAYTPLESLLFFQSLATLGRHPVNFASISDVLRNNDFVRQNVAFDADRLAPEALEDLYTTLMREGVDSIGAAQVSEQNGVHAENPLKRKIASPRPEVPAGMGRPHASLVPDLVSHLYARYKELVTREIRNEEKRFKEIRDEIERLQKEERRGPPHSVPTTTPITAPAVQTQQAKQELAPDLMDLDIKEERPARQLRPELEPPPVQLPSKVDIKQIQQEPQMKGFVPPPQKDTQPNLASRPLENAVVQAPQIPPTPPVTVSHLEQAKKVQQSPQLHVQEPKPQPQPISSHPQSIPHVPVDVLPQRQPVNGNGPPIIQQVANNLPATTPATQRVTNVPPAKSQRPSVAPTPSPGAVPAFTVAPSPAQQTLQKPVPTPAPQPVPAARFAGRQGPTVPTTAPVPQRLPPQPTFQQWSLNKPPHTPRSSSVATPQTLSEKRGTAARPIPTPLPQETPAPEIRKTQQSVPPATAPSTPGPPPTPGSTVALKSQAQGYHTPVGAAQALLSEARGARVPQLSINTRSSTPWKSTPRLSIPKSPGSPERPRPEDVSPISERAPSPIDFPEVPPEEAGGRRTKRRNVEQKATRASREPSLPSTDGEPKGRPKAKVENPSVSAAGKMRDRSATSSRSRGRSMVSREEEATSETGHGLNGKIKHELSSTPAAFPDVPETETRVVGTRKGPTTWAQPEERPGRGRPKRKRGTSDAPEPEPLQTELSRPDIAQSAPYVLCPRNFPRTGAPIMNDVTTHKHASIFAKPLAERDAPGYRDLIYRPQDLKSIKSCIHQGSRAVAAATEAANTPVADGESPAPNAATPSKNAVLVLQKTEDVIPPKAIVNSAQLEKELIRMFANAVMFNPVPQRGFGPAFPMTSDSGSRESTLVPESDEGGIIKDTLEMFEDVEQAVTRWRAAERTADELASKSVLSLRRGSTSDMNIDSADEVKGS